MHIVTTPGQTEQVSISPYFKRLKQFESAIEHHHEKRLRFRNEGRNADMEISHRQSFGQRSTRYEPLTRTFNFYFLG